MPSGSHQTGQNEQPQFLMSKVHSTLSIVRYLYWECRPVFSRPLPSWGSGGWNHGNLQCYQALLRFSWFSSYVNIPQFTVSFWVVSKFQKSWFWQFLPVVYYPLLYWWDGILEFPNTPFSLMSTLCSYFYYFLWIYNYFKIKRKKAKSCIFHIYLMNSWINKV